MTLNSEGLEAANRWFEEEFNGQPNTEALTAGIVSAYLSALPPVDGLEVVAFMHPTANWAHVQYSTIDIHCHRGGPRPIPLVTLSQASSVISGLKEANEALMRERTRLIGELSRAERSFNNIRGAIESNQVVDKDAHGTAIRARDAARQALGDHNG